MIGLLMVTAVLAQESEVAPFNENPSDTAAQNGFNPETLFDVEFSYDIGTTGVIGANSQAGVTFLNDQFWVSTWNSDVVSILDNTGAFVETVFIAGLSGIRSFTSDGTRLWAGTAGNQIFAIDPVNKVILNTINITTTSDATTRMCTYDETLDGGNGGFWIGNFSSDIASVDMSGNELSVIPLGIHNTIIYGGAIDNLSDGGPFLWIADQSGMAPNRHFLTQLDLSTGSPTGIQYDFTPDAPAGNTEVLAGGLFISPAGEAAEEATLISVCQCSPSNILFGVELIESLGTDDNALFDFSMFPVPASGDIVNVKTSNGDTSNIKVEVYDILGKRVIDAILTNDTLNIGNLVAGLYLVRIQQKGTIAQKKLIVR